MKYKIVLLRPNFKGMGKYIPPHMGLASLSSYLKKKFLNEIEVHIVDALVLKESEASIAKSIIDISPDFLLITSKTMQVKSSNIISTLVKKFIDTTIIVGGNHATVKPEDFIYFGSPIDFCVIGEGEHTIVELIKNIDTPLEIDGIAYYLNNKMQLNPQRYLEPDIDNFGFPDWGIMDLNKYNENIHINNIDKAIPIMASRGCPFRCKFCSTYLTWGHNVRFKSVDFLISEIRNNITQYGIKVFHFYDDNLLLNRKWMEEFLNKLILSRLDIEWICLSRSEFIIRNSDILALMKKSGCRGFELGFEAGNDELYSKMNKEIDSETFERAFNLLIEHKFDMIELLLMNFYIGETLCSMYESQKKTRCLIDRGKENGVKILTSRYYSTPLPGTEFFLDAEKEGIYLTEGTEYSFAIFTNFIPKSFINSSTSGFLLDIRKLLIGYDFYFNNYDYIHHKEINQMIEEYSFTNLIKKINEVLYRKVTVGDIYKYLYFYMKEKYDINAVIEFISKIFILAIEQDGLIYGKEENKDFICI